MKNTAASARNQILLGVLAGLVGTAMMVAGAGGRVVPLLYLGLLVMMLPVIALVIRAATPGVTSRQGLPPGVTWSATDPEFVPPVLKSDTVIGREAMNVLRGQLDGRAWVAWDQHIARGRIWRFAVQLAAPVPYARVKHDLMSSKPASAFPEGYEMTAHPNPAVIAPMRAASEPVSWEVADGWLVANGVWNMTASGLTHWLQNQGRTLVAVAKALDGNPSSPLDASGRPAITVGDPSRNVWQAPVQPWGNPAPAQQAWDGTQAPGGADPTRPRW